MNFQHLLVIRETVRQDRDLEKVASQFQTSKTAVARQIREIEEELGVVIFVRTGRRFGGLTAAGQRMLPIVERLIEDARCLLESARELADGLSGTLSIAATHAQVRYVLPSVVSAFRANYPRVKLKLHQGSPEQVVDMLCNGEVDIAIAAEVLKERFDLATFPCHEWKPLVLVPQGHPLLTEPLTLAALSRYPLLTYAIGYSRRFSIDPVFAAAGLKPNVSVYTMDADVIKTYVRLGLGVGVIASLAFNGVRDQGLCAIDAQQLFGLQVTYLALRRNAFLRTYTHGFIEAFDRSLTRERLLSAV